jgi:hypothetical protein
MVERAHAEALGGPPRVGDVVAPMLEERRSLPGVPLEALTAEPGVGAESEEGAGAAGEGREGRGEGERRGGGEQKRCFL